MIQNGTAWSIHLTCCTSCTKGRNVMPAHNSCFSLLLTAVNKLLNSWEITLTPIYFSVSVPVTSTLQSRCCYTGIDKIFHLMGTRGIGITRLSALSRVLSMPRALQSWNLGLLIPMQSSTDSSVNLFRTCSILCGVHSHGCLAVSSRISHGSHFPMVG